VSVIDISMPLDHGIPVWPGSPGVSIEARLSTELGDESNVSTLTMDVHTGTHVDAPRHYLPIGSTLGEMGLNPFVGTADVVDLVDAEVIDESVLRETVADDAQRILLRTRNSVIDGFREAPFRTDFAAITPDGARWLAAREILLVGVDYLSVQVFGDPPDTHTSLLGARVSLLEGLVLNHVKPGRYMLVCLPLHLPGAEAAPARAVLLSERTP
jgi:arylformamidase